MESDAFASLKVWCPQRHSPKSRAWRILRRTRPSKRVFHRRPPRMIEVRATASAGRGVFATAPIQNGTQLVRALPFAIAPSDSCTLTHCCVCLQRVANASKCPRCESAVLCARCAGSASSSKIHDDECAALKLLAAAPADQKPKITRSLRLLIRCLCARWRERIGQPYIGEDGESWWGDGDFAADEMEDIDALVGPPDNDDVESEDSGNGAIDDYEGEDVRSGALSADLFEMAKQARFYASSETRLGHGRVRGADGPPLLQHAHYLWRCTQWRGDARGRRRALRRRRNVQSQLQPECRLVARQQRLFSRAHDAERAHWRGALPELRGHQVAKGEAAGLPSQAFLL